MKILLINTYHYLRGGDSRYTFNLAELLRSKGHEVCHFAMKHPQNLPCEQEKYFVDYIDFVEANQHKDIATTMKVLGRSIYSLHARKQIAQLLDDVGPDIAHLQNIHAHITPSILVELYKRGIPIVWTLHDYKILCPNTNFLSHGAICERCKNGKFYNVVLKRCKKESFLPSLVACLESYVHKFKKIGNYVHRFISPSQFLMNKFIEFGFDPKRFYHIPHFINAQDFIPAFEHQNYCLYIGRLASEKGIDTLLKAMKRIQRVRLLVAGEGPMQSEFEKFVNSNNISNITFIGYKSGDELRDLLTHAMFTVMPSEWYENYPYAIMESFAYGKSVIASRIGGIPELIDHDVNGLLFEPRNVEQLAGQISILSGNPFKLVEYGKQARKKAEILFDPDTHYRQIMDVYSSARVN